MSIKTISQTDQNWNFLPNQKTAFSREYLESTLSALNLIDGQRYYFIDYYNKCLVVESSASLILCGHPKKLADREGFRFLRRIISDEDWKWVAGVNNRYYDVFFDTHPKNRKKLSIALELAFKTADKDEIILHHKIVPYQLCNNGNLWLSLCSVALSRHQKSKHAVLTNTKTGEKYVFDKDRFVKTRAVSLTEEELKILKWLVKGFSAEYMFASLNISESNLKRKKTVLYKKTGVHSAAEAIYWAHLEGVL